MLAFEKTTSFSKSVIVIDCNALSATFTKRKDCDVFVDEIKFNSQTTVEEYMDILIAAGYKVIE